MPRRGGDLHHQEKNITRSSLETSKKNLDEPCTRKGEKFFLKLPSHIPHQSTSKDGHHKASRRMQKKNRAPRRMQTNAHIKEPRRTHTRKASRRMHSKVILEDARRKTSRRMPEERHLEGCTQKGNPKDAQ